MVYQTTWLREFRSFFGSSTAATATVVSVFMAGLGLGSLFFGKRVGTHPAPFRLYANLELFISLSAACSPLLLLLAQHLYLALGGTFVLGPVLGNILRLALAGLILLPPTFLLGGTLPVLAQAFSRTGDTHRRAVAMLYGINTLGAVLGTLLATFVLLQHLGNRWTLWAACLLNVIVALSARKLAQRSLEPEAALDAPNPGTPLRRPLLPGATAAVAGFCFFLMELVWYRMLSPLLGGSTYTFGIILAVALLGVGLGSLLYWLVPRRRPPTLLALAGITALQALCVAVPFALGDQLAILAISLQRMDPSTLITKSVHWFLVASVVVLPTATAAGYQFPLLIALANRGRPGSETGHIYACNTFGAIAGSLAGGFGLLSLVTAPGAWRVAALLLSAMALILAIRCWLREDRRLAQLIPWTSAACALVFLTAPGPTAAWRHTPIGAQRVDSQNWSPNDVQALLNSRNQNLFWEAEGVESSIALVKGEALSLMVNGKSDGNTRTDAPTQILLGLLGAYLHPNPERALVVGLGTGSSAGWLGQVDSIQHVDVIELEPAVVQAARFCAPVNAHAMHNPKVQVHLGDAREAMLTFTQQYDLIASEPSNPYRAGVSSLFTAEFYRAARDRLRRGGVLVQWVQAYEIDGHSIATIYATLGTVFPYVETWQSQPGDLLLLAAGEPWVHDIPALREKIRQAPYKDAFAYVWRITDVEGVFANYIANPGLARAYAHLGLPINTDDHNLLEFAFATCLGINGGFQISKLLSTAEQAQAHIPIARGGTLDYSSIIDRRVSIRILDGAQDNITFHDESSAHRIAAKVAYSKGDYAAALRQWAKQQRPPMDLTEHLILAHSLAELGHDSAPASIQEFHAHRPSEADALMAIYLVKTGHLPEATSLLERCFRDWNSKPWALPKLVNQTLGLAVVIGKESEALALRLSNALATPFAVHLNDLQRLESRRQLIESIDPEGEQLATREFIAEFEPHVPWKHDFLSWRARCYERTRDPLAQAAQRDLARFEQAEPRPLPELPSSPNQLTRNTAP